jgi:hypothetical protein
VSALIVGAITGPGIANMLVGLECIETRMLDGDGQPRFDARELFHVMEVVV